MAEIPVLIVGAGPVGLVLAKELACHGIRSTIVERNFDTTRWPKMDITNCRSMELLHRLGLAGPLRAIGVPSHYSFDVIFSSGLLGREITRWSLPSVDGWWARIRAQNDGSMPREPYQRCSQEVFEAWMKGQCERDPAIHVRSGCQFESLIQDSDGVTGTVLDSASGVTERLRARYLVGCDGASSAVRKSLGIVAAGKAVPRLARLVHFKSRDFAALHAHGQFWHVFFPAATLISQDEIETWTLQHYHAPDIDLSNVDAATLVAESVGRPIEIDRILVTSTWRGQLRVATAYRAGRVFLAGDAAHQNIPTGGYGMNTGVGDAVDIGWKLAAVLNGWGGPALLDSYEQERRPVAERNVARSERHGNVHARWRARVRRDLVDAATPEGDVHRSELAAIIQGERGENEEHGIELGYRYDASPIVVHEGRAAPTWQPRVYTPTSWPGGRPPSVFLGDGSALFDHFGFDFTLLDFAGNGRGDALLAAAAERKVPVRHVVVRDEVARELYGCDLVLIRPDQHVAWRSSASLSEARAVIDLVRGARV